MKWYVKLTLILFSEIINADVTGDETNERLCIAAQCSITKILLSVENCDTDYAVICGKCLIS